MKIMEMLGRVFSSLKTSFPSVGTPSVAVDNSNTAPSPNVATDPMPFVVAFGKRYDGFNRDKVLPDGLFAYDRNLSVQTFLQEKGSFLASYVHKGMLASRIIDDVCKMYDVPQKWILVLLQSKQGAVTRKDKPSDEILNEILGLGATDTDVMVKHRGFDVQLKEVARFSREKFNISILHRNRHMKVDEDKDGSADISIIKNKFTYLIYIYSLWVGCDKHVTKSGVKVGYDNDPYGALLIWIIWKRWWPSDIV